MTDFLKQVIEAVGQTFGPLPKLTDAQLKQFADDMLEKAKAMQAVQTSCPHNETLYQHGGEWHCSWCGQIVHPDPEGLRYGFIEYGRKR